MTNYEKIMQDMTPERLAEINVKLVTVNNTNLFYMTSSGQLFNTSQFDDAVRYEYDWLMYNDQPDMPNVDESNGCEQACDCEKER